MMDGDIGKEERESGGGNRGIERMRQNAFVQPGIMCSIDAIFLSVAVRKLQVAILARSYREMSETVRID